VILIIIIIIPSHGGAEYYFRLSGSHFHPSFIEGNEMMLTRNGNSVYEAWTERLSSNVVVERETIIGGRLSDMCGMMGPYMASSLGLLIPGCPLVLVAVSTLGWLGSVIMVDCDFVEVDQWNLHQSSRCFEGMCLHMERFIVYTPDHHSVKIFSHW